MSNPFARPTEYLPSMTRHGITSWAHDIINELRRLGALDQGNEAASNDLFGVYRNLAQFYTWVSGRPRAFPGHIHRPLESIIRPNQIFAFAHKLWDDLEWELRLEREGAYIEQMIEHLGWFWNIKSNLYNKIRRGQGLSITSNMDTLAEAAKYAEPRNTGPRNIIQPPTAIPLSLRPVSPASRDNPRRAFWNPGSRKGREQASHNTIQSGQANSARISSMQSPKTGHLQVPQLSRSIREQPQASMQRALSAYSAQAPKSSPGTLHQLPVSRDETSRNIIGRVHNGNDNGMEYSSISRLPIGSILPTPQTRVNRYSNGTRGFSDGSKLPMISIPDIKPALDNDNDHASRNNSRSYHRDYKDSDGGMESIKSENSSSNSNSNKNVVMITDSPPLQSTDTPIYNRKSQDRSNNLSSPSLSFENLEFPRRLPSANIPQMHTDHIDLLRQATSSSNSWTPINDRKNYREMKSTEPGETEKSLDRRSGEQDNNDMEETNVKRPNSSSGNQDTVTVNPNKKAKMSRSPKASPSQYVSPYSKSSNQEHPTPPNKSATMSPVQISVRDNPTPAKFKSARDIYRPFSIRKSMKKED
ncbi:hypothetical protein NHQ30_002964 [Ciborinia camelliae]|nr:hypothetical protein NHQ30_002964 [Ciborinia camelliae]